MRYWLVILAATLAACGGSSSSPPAQQIVADTTPPVITLTGNNPQFIEAGDAYTELGATAADNVDGDLSASIIIEASGVDTSIPDDYTVNYEVSDAAGNTGTVTRTVTVQDTTPPVISLLGDDPQVVITGNPYTELGATASDSLDGDLTDAIVIDASAVDATVAGNYDVSYDVSDAAGNAAATVTRAVRIQNPPLPAAPTASIEGDIKKLIFNWDAVAGAEYFRLLENADGHSGFTQVGDDIPADTLTATRDIAVHLFDWIEAQYLVEACNIAGCNSSTVITATDVMLDTIEYIKASNPDEGDGFGHIALSEDGKTLAVGVPGEDSSATGVNGDQADNSAWGAGAVYLFRFGGSYWTQQAYIKASNTEAEDNFGAAIALSGDGSTLAVGARGEDSIATGINGNQADNSASGGGPIGSGAVYLYRYDDKDWYQQAYIKASNTRLLESAGFGGSVALSTDGNTLAVGAIRESGGSTGINGDQNDDTGYLSGAVYLFRFGSTGWYQQAYIKASNTGQYDYFGGPLALSDNGNALAVGAQGEDSSATGINGDQDDDSATLSGAVYIFRSDGTDWYQEAYIKASNTESGDRFSSGALSLSADGDTLAVGTPLEDSLATGINGDQYNDQDIEGCGAVYVFRFDGTNWYQQAYVKASNTGSGNMQDCDPRHPDLCSWAGDSFGRSVTLSSDGNTMAVGASGEDSSATGINGDQTDDSAIGAGAVYLFRSDGMDWSQRAYVKAPNTDSGDSFSAVALSGNGNTLAVGAGGEDSSATGISGDQADNSAEDAGAVYIY